MSTEDDIGINEIARGAFETAREKGWHEPDPSDGHVVTLVERLALIHSEVSEALEAYRSHGLLGWKQDGKPEGVAAELADVVIRVAELCWMHEIDLASIITEKMQYNSTRPRRHGGKRL